jgi:hypothetical protein
MYCKPANVGFCKTTVTFWELCTNFTKEMYINIYCTVFVVQLLMGEAGKEPVGTYYIVLNMKSDDANMNDLQFFKISRQLICDIYQGM